METMPHTTLYISSVSKILVQKNSNEKGLVSIYPLTMSNNNPLDKMLCVFQSEFDSGGNKEISPTVRNRTLVIQSMISYYTVETILDSSMPTIRDKSYLKQSIPERNVTVPCSHERLSSKMFATVSRHVRHFSAEENSVKVWHSSLATSVDGGVCAGNVQTLLK